MILRSPAAPLQPGCSHHLRRRAGGVSLLMAWMQVWRAALTVPPWTFMLSVKVGVSELLSILVTFLRLPR